MGSLRIVANTAWSVAQDRSHERGDDDVFTRVQTTGDDWIELDCRARVNLCLVSHVHLSFGTYAEPNYQGVLTDELGHSVRIAGPRVLRLQDELLRRTTQHSLLDRSAMPEAPPVAARRTG